MDSDRDINNRLGICSPLRQNMKNIRHSPPIRPIRTWAIIVLHNTFFISKLVPVLPSIYTSPSGSLLVASLGFTVLMSGKFSKPSSQKFQLTGSF